MDQVESRIAALAEAGEISGAVGLVWQNGKVQREFAVGYRDVEQVLPMERDSIFRLASMTKPITATLALMLMEEGAFALDDSIIKWMPEFSDPAVLLNPEGPLNETQPPHRNITFRDLLTHRSGIAYGFTASGPIADAYDDRFGDVRRAFSDPDTWLATLGRLPLLFQPGERMHYGYSTDVLGFAVARAAGRDFSDLVHERILEPLGMLDTAFWVAPENQNRIAQLYRSEDGNLGRVHLPVADAPPVFCAGGGGLVSTARDYLKFARILLNHGEADGVRLLESRTVELMRTNQLTAEQRQMTFLGMPYWVGMGFGLGMSVIIDPAKQAWMGPGNPGSFGWPGAWGTWWQADPVLGLIMIYMIQNSISLPSANAQRPAGRPVQPRPGLSILQDSIYA